MENKEEKINNSKSKTVHFILLHSYSVFLFAIILGLFLDPILKKKLFSDDIYQTVGFIIIVIGSILILWAQNTTGINKKVDDARSYFNRGPYKYIRSPTHLGLFIMTLGFSLVINSFFSLILTFMAYIFTKFLFVKKQEQILERKYGEIYTDYKKKTKNWL